MITTTSKATKDGGHFYVTWTPDSAIKRIEITNSETGVRTVGSDWASWDIAYQQALHQMFSPRATFGDPTSVTR